MGRRALPVVLVLAAALADHAGMHALAFYGLFAAVPAAAAAALASFGAFLEARGDAVASLQALLWPLAVVLLLLAAATRAPLVAQGTVPAVGRSALAGCIGVLAVKAIVAVGALLTRAPTRAPSALPDS